MPECGYPRLRVAIYSLDITPYACPLTWVKTKLELETMTSGEVLVVRLNRGEPLSEVPRTAREEGHLVEGDGVAGDGPPVELRIVKDGLRAGVAPR